MSDYIIVVAGGKGLRMGSDIPKQFLPIGAKPVLMRTLERFREYSDDLQIILVLPEAQQEYWQELCKKYDFKVEYLLANGGQTRFHSVQNGLALMPDDAEGVVGVHDGVRPFPSIEVIRYTDNDHYWNLTQCDGQWYHFDTTPRSWGGSFCLLTDAEMLAYSHAHGGCFEFDRSLYPPTP